MCSTTLDNTAQASQQSRSAGKREGLITKAAPLTFSNSSCGEVDASIMHHPSSPANRFLSKLPKSDLKRLEAHLSQVALERGQMLLERGHSMERIYFPTSGLVSLLLDGRQSGNGVGVVGHNGMVGTVSALGTNPTFSRARVEIAGNALAIPAPVLREEFTQGGALQDLLLRHLQTQIIQASQLALCVRTHPLEQRLSHWLLLIQDEVPQSEIKLNLSFFAHLLQTSYTETVLAAALLWRHGVIRFCDDYIVIHNRPELEECSCSCYRIIRHAHDHSSGVN